MPRQGSGALVKLKQSQCHAAWARYFGPPENVELSWSVWFRHLCVSKHSFHRRLFLFSMDVGALISESTRSADILSGVYSLLHRPRRSIPAQVPLPNLLQGSSPDLAHQENLSIYQFLHRPPKSHKWHKCSFWGSCHVSSPSNAKPQAPQRQVLGIRPWRLHASHATWATLKKKISVWNGGIMWNSMQCLTSASWYERELGSCRQEAQGQLD